MPGDPAPLSLSLSGTPGGSSGETNGTPALGAGAERKDPNLMAASRGRHAPSPLGPNLLALAGLVALFAAAGGAGLVPFLVALGGLGLLLAAAGLHSRRERQDQRRRDVDSVECAICPHVRVAHRRDDGSCAICGCPRFLVSVDQVGDLVEAGLLDLDCGMAPPAAHPNELGATDDPRRRRP